MALTATHRPMTVGTFLDWHPTGDTRYELFNGTPVPMAPTSTGHRLVSGNLCTLIRGRLASPCRVESEAGVKHPDRDDTFFVADLAVSCVPPSSLTQPFMNDPSLIVEILPPSTADDDRLIKLPVYRQMPTVREILLVHLLGTFVEAHRRAGTTWPTDLLLTMDAVLRLDSVGLDTPLSAIYAGTEAYREGV